MIVRVGKPMKKHLISLLVLFLLVSTSLVGVLNTLPAQAMNQTDMSPDSQEQYLSSIELFLQRKAYPYEYKAFEYQKYFTQNQVSPEVNEETMVYSLFAPSVLDLSGPMNSSWPMKSFNAQRIGRTTSSTEDNLGLEKWRFQTWISGVDSGAVVTDDNTIIFGSKDYYIYAMNPNGTLKWKYETGGPIFSDPAVAADGTIYITSCDHRLYSLNPSGTLKWKFNTGDIVSASPVIADDGTIYIGHSQGRVFAINPNGTELWHYDLPNDIYGSAALGHDGTIYIGCWNNCFYALNPNGTLKWSFPTGNKVKGVPSLASDGTIYLGSWDGYLYALYPNGTMQWRCGVGSGTETTPAMAEDGTIYIGGDDLYAVYSNGTLRWTFYLGNNRHIFTSCPAISADGTIYVGVDVGETTAGEILAVNPNGTERWRKLISDEWCDSSPAIAADGSVYIGSTGMNYGNALHAFGPIESNLPPNPPTIEGPIEGDTGAEYGYEFHAIDPDNNPIQVFVDWGDGTSGWSYEDASGGRIYISHTWENEGTYIIKTKARDTPGVESNWTVLSIHITSFTLSIKNRFLFLTAEMKNTGTTDITNISWNIWMDPDRGILIYPRENISGTTQVLKPGDKLQVKTALIGFGIIYVYFNAYVKGVRRGFIVIGPYLFF
jgi:outer membrane protein assembly factor BamB